MLNRDEYITTNEAAGVLEVTRQRVLQLIQDGRLKAEKFGNVYMIRRPDLSNIEAKPMGRPPKSSATEKTATAKANVSNGASASKRKGKK